MHPTTLRSLTMKRYTLNEYSHRSGKRVSLECLEWKTDEQWLRVLNYYASAHADPLLIKQYTLYIAHKRESLECVQPASNDQWLWVLKEHSMCNDNASNNTEILWQWNYVHLISSHLANRRVSLECLEWTTAEQVEISAFHVERNVQES